MKKKIFSIALVACLVVLSIAGASVAYFTDTDDATNVFTSGNVNIELTSDTLNTNNSYPGEDFDINATIDVVDGSMDAYVGAIIILEAADDADITDFLAANDTGAIEAFLGLDEITGCTVTYDADADPYKVYVVVNNKMTADATPVEILKTITIPTTWGNEEMEAFDDFKLDIKAYATQTVGFADGTTAGQALYAAFGSDWAVFAPATP